MRGGKTLGKVQILHRKFCAVLTDKVTGFRVALHGADPARRGGQRQLHTDAAGACAYIPEGICGAHSQLGQRGSADLLLGHRRFAADERCVGQAGRAAQGRGHIFHKQDTERCKALCGQLLRRAGHKPLGRRAEVLPYRGRSVAQPGSRQLLAERRGGLAAAGQEKVVPPARQAATGSQAQPWAETSRQLCHGRPSAAANNCTLETPGSTVYGRPPSSNARQSAAAPE